MPRYLDLAIGAKNRLAILRANASKRNANFASQCALTWKQMRHARFNEPYSALCQGFNPEGNRKTPVWTAFEVSALPGRVAGFADEIKRYERSIIDHSGWFCDPDQDSKARGFVLHLTQSRYMAGYYWDSNGEYVLYPELYDNPFDAARAGDEHARVMAEKECEFQEADRAAQRLVVDISEAKDELRKNLALRNDSRFDVRGDIEEQIAQIRKMRERLEAQVSEHGLDVSEEE